jgi:Etoposide-induced protein 2.4 (EI24)
MKSILDAFMRAGLYCLMPRVIALSFLPLLLMVVLSWGLGYLYWDAAVSGVRQFLEQFSLLSSLWSWMEQLGVPDLKTVVAPLLVIVAVTPLVVVVSLFSVSAFMTPGLTRMVLERRFASMERKRGASVLQSLLWSLFSLLLAMGALLLTLPLWLVPPLALVLPALIWGWLTYRVMTFDVLSDIADASERQALMAQHRLSLLGMGIVSGMMGAAPGVVWASGALFAAAFVILVPVAIWIYTLVFVFSSLWYAHFLLDGLSRLRQLKLPMSSDVAEATVLREEAVEPIPPRQLNYDAAADNHRPAHDGQS